MKKKCLQCSKIIFEGRSDKKFCNNNCRITYHNNLDKGVDYKKSMVDRVIKFYNNRKNTDPISHILWRCRDSAKKKGFVFNLEYNDLHIPDVCPLLNIKLRYDDFWSCPSIDRIDSSKGYIKGNVWIISRKANHMKQDVSIKMLKTFCKNVLNKM